MSKRICIVCEGYEEFDYINRLKQCAVWSGEYAVKSQNAKSLDNVFAVYQNEYQSDNYDLVVVYCDTEKSPYEKFTTMCEKINKFHDKQVTQDIVFFVNPCTLQIILSHFDVVKLKSNLKSDNANLVERLTGVKEYIAKKQQRESIMKKVNKKNYLTMKTNISNLPLDRKKCPSSNFIELLSRLELTDTSWVDELKDKIDG